MKHARELEIDGDRHSRSVAVGYKGSDMAIAWFWSGPGMDALKNAREYIRLLQRAKSPPRKHTR
jgi:hypothetical protein